MLIIDVILVMIFVMGCLLIWAIEALIPGGNDSYSKNANEPQIISRCLVSWTHGVGSALRDKISSTVTL